PARASLANAAASYQAFRERETKADVDAWCDSYPGNADEARVFRDVHAKDPRAAENLAEAVAGFPEVGRDFLGFRLIQQLARGAFARVYLARQGELADRYVALKVSPDVRGESRTLAQLQHTNIVPIYSIHRAKPFQVVCMPFYGATTLADVLKALTVN